MHTVSPRSTGCTTILTISLKGEAAPSSGEVLVLDMSKFHGGRWALQLDAAISRRTEPVILAARGVACLAVAWWAKLSPKIYTRGIEGAIFEAPLQVGFGQAHIAAAASVSPAIKLPFPSIVTNPASPVIEQVLALADSWGSHFIDTDHVEGEHPSNRRPPANAVEQHLVRLLDRTRGIWARDERPVGADVGPPEVFA